ALGEFAVILASAQPQLLFDLLDGQPVDAVVHEYGIDTRCVAASRRVRAQSLDAIQQCAPQILRLAQPVTVAAGGPWTREGVALAEGIVVEMQENGADRVLEIVRPFVTFGRFRWRFRHTWPGCAPLPSAAQ